MYYVICTHPIPVPDRCRAIFCHLLQILSLVGCKWGQLHTVPKWRWPGRSSAAKQWQICRLPRVVNQQKYTKWTVVKRKYAIFVAIIIHVISHLKWVLCWSPVVSLVACKISLYTKHAWELIFLTTLAVAVCTPVRNNSSPKESAAHKLRWTKLWSFWINSFL